AAVATYNSRKATLELARANLKRGEELAPSGGISKEDLDVRKQTVKVDEAAVEQALQQVYAIRVALGLPSQPPKGHELTEVPPGLEQNFSTVREVLGELIQSAAQLGYFPTSWDATPSQAIAAFYSQDPGDPLRMAAFAVAGGAPGAVCYKQDPSGALDRIYASIIPNAPPIKQARAKLEQVRRDLDNAELNLRYCDVVSDIDGVVTRRNVNAGDYVQVAQG